MPARVVPPRGSPPFGGRVPLGPPQQLARGVLLPSPNGSRLVSLAPVISSRIDHVTAYCWPSILYWHARVQCTSLSASVVVDLHDEVDTKKAWDACAGWHELEEEPTRGYGWLGSCVMWTMIASFILWLVLQERENYCDQE